MGKLRDLRKFFERKFLEGHDPDFLIVGTQKSGTSTLHYLLNKHPKLAGSWPKEMRYFSILRFQNKDLNWYRSHFTSFKNNALYFEATPHYINLEHVAKQIKETYPSIKLIIILRNPIDRAYSAWNMFYDHFKKGKFKKRAIGAKENSMYRKLIEGRNGYPTFHEALELEREMIRIDEPDGVNFMRKGLYYNQIEPYLKYFDRKQILILGTKDLNNPQELFNNILNFLNVVPVKWNIPRPVKKNKRTYANKMAEADREFLEEYFRIPNQKLKDLLGYQVNW